MNFDKAREMKAEQDAADAVNEVKRYRVRLAWSDGVRWKDVMVDAATPRDAMDYAMVDGGGWDEPSDTYDDSCGPTYIDNIAVVGDDGEDAPAESPIVIPASLQEPSALATRGPSVIYCDRDGAPPNRITLAAFLMMQGHEIEPDPRYAVNQTHALLSALASGNYFAHRRLDKATGRHEFQWWACLVGTTPEARDFAHGCEIWADQEASANA